MFSPKPNKTDKSYSQHSQQNNVSTNNATISLCAAAEGQTLSVQAPHF